MDGLTFKDIASDPFVSLATLQGQAWGWNVPIARVTHPVGGILKGELAGRADQVADYVVEQTAVAAQVTSSAAVVVEDRFEAPADPEAFYEFVQLRGWGDGEFVATDYGVPTIYVGPDTVAAAHTADEHIDLDRYHMSVGVYERAIQEFLLTAKAS